MYHKPLTKSGLTLPELMVSVCIIGFLAAFAVPNFMNMIAENRLTSSTNELVAALAFTRSEAIKRGVQVTIKHKDNTPKQWEEGWDIFTDSNGNGLIDESSPDVLLIAHESLPEGYTLRTGSNYAEWIAYLEAGNFRSSSGFANDTFRLCDESADKKRSRAIIIKMGRVRIEANKVKECP